MVVKTRENKSSIYVAPSKPFPHSSESRRRSFKLKVAARSGAREIITPSISPPTHQDGSSVIIQSTEHTTDTSFLNKATPMTEHSNPEEQLDETFLELSVFEALYGDYTDESREQDEAGAPSQVERAFPAFQQDGFHNDSTDDANLDTEEVKLSTDMEGWQCWDKCILNTEGETRTTFQLGRLIDHVVYGDTQATLGITFKVAKDNIEHTSWYPVHIQCNGSFQIKGNKMPKFQLFKTPNMKSNNRATEVDAYMTVQLCDGQRQSAHKTIFTAAKPNRFPEQVKEARKRNYDRKSTSSKRSRGDSFEPIKRARLEQTPKLPGLSLTFNVSDMQKAIKASLRTLETDSQMSSSHADMDEDEQLQMAIAASLYG
ncbi:hypothetical protein PROFUN_00905 [Planoprotostelium fungivorum]|uniref:Uncharacterized protein n=1 Tax=Planoprotostelium fungivorum TaxID=1890364 RepID=A0A2P6P098_9EUKA|nr:hypothetical protein PROFUN_00905 [Planoprotostelium fungivorum]